MQNQKLENLLNLALGAAAGERAESGNLAVGFNDAERTWELIVKHSGPLDGMLAELRGRSEKAEATELLNGYSILNVPESAIGQVSEYPQVEYVEKPKRLYFAVNRAASASCVPAVQVAGSAYAPNLSGRGVLVAVLDSGIDYYHEDFRNPDGSTRIAALWDQTLGKVFTREEINAALASESRLKARQLVPSADGSGHGTAVAGIAAGNGRESGGQYRGIAYESELVVVKLGTADPLGFPRTTELMRALDYAARYAAAETKPMAVNLSFGNTYGSHDGASLLETYIDGIADYGRLEIVIGTGNEGGGSGHISGTLTGRNPVEIELSVSGYETGLSVQLWKEYVDEMQITLVTPSGQELGPLPPVIGPRTLNYAGTRILLYYGEPSPYSLAQEIYFDFIPRQGDYLAGGIWKFRLTPERIVRGRYDFWLPSSAVLNRATGFLGATPDTTLTIPSTARKALSVGAYNGAYQTYADFSGRGFTRLSGQVKPELAAPGVNLMAPKAGGGYEPVTGTSFSAPVACGSAALLMQWGIVDGNDPFLYGEKLKAYFIRGARQLPGYASWPNPQLGWGVLCVRDSLPG